jgi:hypothetical protein
VLGKPADMDHDDCSCLSVLRTRVNNHRIPVVISCWKLTAEELEEINSTGRIWLMVSGETMPPAVVSGTKPV